jgi:hypothetical protein
MDTIKNNMEALTDACKEAGLEVNSEKHRTEREQTGHKQMRQNEICGKNCNKSTFYSIGN